MKQKDVSFEAALKRLEKIADDLENDDISLEDSLGSYEEGMKLMAICQKKLEEAKKKVDVLAKNDGGKFKLQNFDDESIKQED